MNTLYQLYRQHLKNGIIVFLSTLLLLLTGCTITNDTPAQNLTQVPSTASEVQPLTSFSEVADYIRKHQQLPSNFITKEEARALGWEPSEGNLHLVAPGKSIGGDRFGNRERLLPEAKGRVWYEADIDYNSGSRNAKRIVFSNDGLIYMTTDHYATFKDITKEGSIINE